MSSIILNAHPNFAENFVDGNSTFSGTFDAVQSGTLTLATLPLGIFNFGILNSPTLVIGERAAQ